MGKLESAVILVPAGTPFFADPKTAEPFTKLIISPEFVANVGRETFRLAQVNLTAEARDGDADLRAAAYLLSEAATGHQPLDDEMIAFIAHGVAIHLISNFAEQRVPAYTFAGRIPSAKLVTILDYIGDNLARPLTVRELASHTGYSQTQFSRAFTNSTGRSPHAYIVARRVALAQRLLRSTNLSIDRIAARCGFHDQAHMTKTFSRLTGVTPRRYRSN